MKWFHWTKGTLLWFGTGIKGWTDGEIVWETLWDTWLTRARYGNSDPLKSTCLDMYTLFLDPSLITNVDFELRSISRNTHFVVLGYKMVLLYGLSNGKHEHPNILRWLISRADLNNTLNGDLWSNVRVDILLIG